MSIPKIIHYCWLSGEPFPEEIHMCIDSWKEKLPGYEIKLWSCENFDVNISQYTKEAFECRKYAFVSDYVRLYVLYNEGGIYLDSDVKAIATFDSLLNEPAFIGYESGGRLGPWLIASEKRNPLIKELLDFYEGKSFYKENGEMNLTPNTVPVTNILTKHGLVPDNRLQRLDYITICPEDYFCPKNPWNGKINITDNTIAMHLFMGAWNDTADSDLQFISSIDKYVEAFVHELKVSSCDRAIIYGLGVVGRNALEELKNNKDISIECILVTKRDNGWTSVDSIPIIEIENSISVDRNIPVLITTNPKYHRDIESTLHEFGYRNVFFLGGQEYENNPVG